MKLLFKLLLRYILSTIHFTSTYLQEHCRTRQASWRRNYKNSDSNRSPAVHFNLKKRKKKKRNSISQSCSGDLNSMECHFCRNANLNHCIVPQGLSWTDLDNIGAGCFQMNVCVLSARLYLVSLSCRKWRSELSKCRDLASKCGGSHRKLHHFGSFFLFHIGLFFSPLFSISLRSVETMLQAKTWERAVPMHFKCHVMFVVGQQYFRNMLAVKSDCPGFNLRLTGRSCTHLFALHITDNPKAEHSITPCVGRCAHCTLLPHRSLVLSSGFVFICIFFFLTPSSNKPVLATHSFALFGCRCDRFCLCLHNADFVDNM